MPARDLFSKKYSWTITDPATVDFVVNNAHSSVVDPMAGTGWWGYLLQQAGVVVYSYDRNPYPKNHWHSHEPHTFVTRRNCTRSVQQHPESTLLLSWPPYKTDDGYNAVKKYAGHRIIYIGEEQGGCTGNDAMFTELQQWNLVAEHRPVRWPGIHDTVSVYERRRRWTLR